MIAGPGQPVYRAGTHVDGLRASSLAQGDDAMTAADYCTRRLGDFLCPFARLSHAVSRSRPASTGRRSRVINGCWPAR